MVCDNPQVTSKGDFFSRRCWKSTNKLTKVGHQNIIVFFYLIHVGRYIYVLSLDLIFTFVIFLFRLSCYPFFTKPNVPLSKISCHGEVRILRFLLKLKLSLSTFYHRPTPVLSSHVYWPAVSFGVTKVNLLFYF